MSSILAEVEEVMGRCVHFNGIQHDRCDVGLSYEEVRGEGPGLPCLRKYSRGKTCALAVFPARDAAERIVEEDLRLLAEAVATIAAGVCPICDKPVAMRQVGACVYGECGHRLGRGELKATR